MAGSEQPSDGEMPAYVRRPYVFISYKTREHQPYVERVKGVLREAGFSTWLDEDHTIPPFQSQGLDIALSAGLTKADALLFLVPYGEQRLAWAQMTWGQRLRKALDILDLVLIELARESGAGVPLILAATWVQVFWYKFWYGIDIEKHPLESWQQWEARVGQAFGATVTRAAIVTREQDASSTPADVRVLRDDHLEEDLYEEVIPALRRAATERQPLEMLPGRQGLYRWLQKWGPVLVRVALVILVPMAALERFWETLTGLPRRIWQAVRSGFLRITAFVRRGVEPRENNHPDPG